MLDSNMTNILKHFNSTEKGTKKIIGPLRSTKKILTATVKHDTMKAILNEYATVEGLDAQQRSVNQMPGTHIMAKNGAKHPANKFLVGGEHDEHDEEKFDDPEFQAFRKDFLKQIGHQDEEDIYPDDDQNDTNLDEGFNSPRSIAIELKSMYDNNEKNVQQIAKDAPGLYRAIVFTLYPNAGDIDGSELYWDIIDQLKSLFTEESANGRIPDSGQVVESETDYDKFIDAYRKDFMDNHGVKDIEAIAEYVKSALQFHEEDQWVIGYLKDQGIKDIWGRIADDIGSGLNEAEAEPKKDYAQAIKFREQSIERFKTNPPEEWTPEYVQKNIDAAQAQIDSLRKSAENKIEEAQRGIPNRPGWQPAVDRAKDQMLDMRKRGKSDRYIADMLVQTMQNVSMKNLPILYKAIGLKLKEAQPAAKGKSKENFTADDLQELNGIKDLDELKQRAITLVSTDSDRPMAPEKVEWFTRKISEKTDNASIIKLMWDLLLAGEGNSVFGSGSTTGKSSYRKKFKETDQVKRKSFGKRKPVSNIHKKQSLTDIFHSMDETEEEQAAQFKKELHAKRMARELSKGENGKFNLVEDIRADALFDLQSIIKNLAFFSEDTKSIEKEFATNNGDTFIALAKKIIAAVESVRARSVGESLREKEASPQLKTKDARAAQIIKTARNQYSGKASDDLSAIVNMMYDKDLEHEDELSNLDDYNMDQDVEIDDTQVVNVDQETAIADILDRLMRLEKNETF